MAVESFRSGSTTLKLNQTAVIAGLDRVMDGAATSFLHAARATLKPIEDNAVIKGPRNSGDMARAYTISDRVTPDTLAVVLSNQQNYSFKVRYSVRTAEEMDRSAKSLFASGPDDQSVAVQVLMNKRHKRRVPVQELRVMWRKELTKWHGTGAPTEAIAGKNHWSWNVRRNVRKGEAGLIDEVRADLDKLAGAF